MSQIINQNILRVSDNTVVRPENSAAVRKGVPESNEPRMLRYQVANLQGIGTCPRQEDSFAFVNALGGEQAVRNGMMAILADGMGGMSGGKEASETAISTIKTDFQDYDPNGNIPDQLAASAVRADKIIYDMLGGNGGCTLAACLFLRNKMYFVSEGDSFIYLLRNGRLFRLNHEFNIVHESYLEAIHNRTVSAKSVVHRPDDEALTHFIGDGSGAAPERLVRPMDLYVGDIVMLCSDGVGDFVTENQVIEALGKKSTDEMCAELDRCINEGAEGKYRDNYTALIVKCTY